MPLADDEAISSPYNTATDSRNPNNQETGLGEHWHQLIDEAYRGLCYSAHI